MLPQALAGISLFLFSLFLFSLFSLPVQKATLGRAGPAHKRYKCFCRPSQASLSFSFLSFSFLFSLYRFRKQRSARPVPPSNYKCFCRPSQVVYLSFSFLFSLYRFRKQRYARPVPPSNATNSSAGPCRYLSLSLFSFLLTGSESNVRPGRSRLQTLQMLPQALAGISLFLFSLFFLRKQR